MKILPEQDAKISEYFFFLIPNFFKFFCAFSICIHLCYPKATFLIVYFISIYLFYFILFYFIKATHDSTNKYWWSSGLQWELTGINRSPVVCVDYREGEKSEYPEKNSRSTGEINYEKLQLTWVVNPREAQTRPGLGFFFKGARQNALTTWPAVNIKRSRIYILINVANVCTKWLCANKCLQNLISAFFWKTFII